MERNSALRIIMTLVLVMCAAPVLAQAPEMAQHIAGFWTGIMDGLASPFTWLFSFIVPDLPIKTIPNNGSNYEMGFFLGGLVSWMAFIGLVGGSCMAVLLSADC